MILTFEYDIPIDEISLRNNFLKRKSIMKKPTIVNNTFLDLLYKCFLKTVPEVSVCDPEKLYIV